MEEGREKKGRAKGGNKKKGDGGSQGASEIPWQQQKKHLREADDGRKQEIKEQIEAFAQNARDDDSIAFDPKIPSHERKWIHHFAEEHGLCHESVGLGKARHVKVWKAAPPTDWTIETLSVSMKRRFVKDFGFHIKCYDTEDFKYLLDLYDPYYQTNEKIQLLIAEIKRCGGEAAFLNSYFGTKDKIIDDLKASEAYTVFSQDELERFKIPEEQKLPPSVYGPENDGKYFLSLDLKDANFNALLFYDPKLTKGATSWNGLLKDVYNVDSPYILSCKEFRSAVFHAVSSMAFPIINNWRIFGFYQELIEHGVLKKETPCYHNNDELIIQMETHSLEGQQKVLEDIQTFLKNNTPKTLTPDILRIEAFRLKNVPNCTKNSKHLKFYAKEMLDLSTGEVTSVTFKGVPPTHFAVCFKSYHGMPITTQDCKFWNERTDAYEFLSLLDK